jgi:hypothetical protein
VVAAEEGGGCGEGDGEDVGLDDAEVGLGAGVGGEPAVEDGEAGVGGGEGGGGGGQGGEGGVEGALADEEDGEGGAGIFWFGLVEGAGKVDLEFVVVVSRGSWIS